MTHHWDIQNNRDKEMVSKHIQGVKNNRSHIKGQIPEQHQVSQEKQSLQNLRKVISNPEFYTQPNNQA